MINSIKIFHLFLSTCQLNRTQKIKPGVTRYHLIFIFLIALAIGACEPNDEENEVMNTENCPESAKTVDRKPGYFAATAQLAFLENGETYCTDNDGTLFQIQGTSMIKKKEGIGLAIAAKGNKLYGIIRVGITSFEAGLGVWNSSSQSFDAVATNFRALDIRFSPNGEVWGYTSGGIYRYNPSNGQSNFYEFDSKLIGGFGSVAHNEFEAMDFSADGKYLWLAGQTGLGRWEIKPMFGSNSNNFKDKSEYQFFPYPFNSTITHKLLIDQTTGRIFVKTGQLIYELDTSNKTYSSIIGADDLTKDHRGNVWLIEGYTGDDFTLSSKLFESKENIIKIDAKCSGKLNDSILWQTYFNHNGKEVWIEYPYEFDNGDVLLAQVYLK